MRTTIDLPDALFRDLKVAAVRRGTTLKTLVVESIENELRGRTVRSPSRIQQALVPRKGRHSIDLTNAQIEDVLTGR